MALHSIDREHDNQQFQFQTHPVNVCEKSAHLWRKESLHVDLLSHLNYKVHGKVSIRHQWKTHEMDRIPRISGLGEVYATMTGMNEKKKSWLVLPEQKSAGWEGEIVNEF